MAKADLVAAQAAYDDDMSAARKAETERQFSRALRYAVSAWDHVDGMMQYERRYEEKDFKSVPCVDMVLRLAPLLFDIESLEHMTLMLKARKGVERHTSDDLGERLERARNRLHEAHRLWSLLEQNTWTRQDELRSRLGGEQEDWRTLADRWEGIGVIERRRESGAVFLRLSTDMDENVPAKCSACGQLNLVQKVRCLGPITCPHCQRTCVPVISRPDATAPRGETSS